MHSAADESWLKWMMFWWIAHSNASPLSMVGEIGRIIIPKYCSLQPLPCPRSMQWLTWLKWAESVSIVHGIEWWVSEAPSDPVSMAQAGVQVLHDEQVTWANWRCQELRRSDVGGLLSFPNYVISFKLTSFAAVIVQRQPTHQWSQEKALVLTYGVLTHPPIETMNIIHSWWSTSWK